MTRIVILGAGFAGLSAALRLEKALRNKKEISITLIDRHDYHLFTPNLYEVVAAEEELASISQLKKSVTVPLKEVLGGRKIKFIKGELKQINQLKRKVAAGSREVDYDYLVVALGSVPDFHGIEGAEKFALPLNSLTDALRVRNAVEFAVQRRRLEVSKKALRFVIVGGGCSSVEVAGELKGLLDEVAWKNGYDREKLEIMLTEASGRLLPDLDERASKEALFRLKELGIRVELSHRLSEVDNNFVEFLGGERLEYDVLIWIAGTKAPAVPFAHVELKDGKGRLAVNDYLQLEDFHNIFVIGDLSAPAAGQSPFYGDAEQALAQASCLAKALPKIMLNQQPRPFKLAKDRLILNIGGKWAIVQAKGKYFSGFMAYLIGQWVRFNYYRQVCGFGKAIKYWWLQRELYGRND